MDQFKNWSILKKDRFQHGPISQMDRFQNEAILKLDRFKNGPILRIERFQNGPIPKMKLKIELFVSFYSSSGSIKDYRFHICHYQLKNDASPKSRSICQQFHYCQLWNVNSIDTSSNFRWNDLNLPQSLNFSFRSSNSCWAYSYNSISSEFIARILKQTGEIKSSSSKNCQQL